MKKSENKSGIKKGNSSWKPASLNEFTNKEDGYRYRMIRKDPDNLAKKQQEGWEIISKMNDKNSEHVDPNRIEHGKPLTSVLEGRDWVYARMTEDMALERDKYHEQKNTRQVAGLTSHLKKELHDKGGNAPLHGEITISSRKGEQIIN